MSGGVDSSVAAGLLLRDGYEVVGCFMRLGSPDEAIGALIPHQTDTVRGAVPPEPDEPAPACSSPPSTRHTARSAMPPRRHKQGCCSISDAHDAKLVAAELGIPLYICNFRRDFERIMDYFVSEHRAGRTPNPCVRCNDWLKFGKLHAYAGQIGAEFVASGHHARIRPCHHAHSRLGQTRHLVDGRDALPTSQGAELWRGVDESKDQSYVLFGIPREQLRQTLLPVGEMSKAEVRALAEEMSLPVFDKPDSQEICFIPNNDHATFLERRAPELRTSGKIVDTNGRIVGEHGGHHQFTIGQRRGVGVAFGRPVYVIEKAPESNTVVVGSQEELAVAGFKAGDVNWLPARDEHDAWQTERDALVQFRAHGQAFRARIRLNTEEDILTVDFEKPVYGVAPGQAAVCYDVDRPERVLGGGWIHSTRRE